MNIFKPVAVATTALALICAPTAFAGSDKHSVPGTPGAANCVGQTTAYLAQVDLGVPGEHPGIGGVSDVTGLTNAEIRAIVEAYCAQ